VESPNLEGSVPAIAATAISTCSSEAEGEGSGLTDGDDDGEGSGSPLFTGLEVSGPEVLGVFSGETDAVFSACACCPPAGGPWKISMPHSTTSAAARTISTGTRMPTPRLLMRGALLFLFFWMGFNGVYFEFFMGSLLKGICRLYFYFTL
jgi:hypothetical protein